MTKTIALALSAVALAALAACETTGATATPSGVTTLAMKPKSCVSQDPNVPVGNPPVVSYYCRAPAGAPDDVQLDVYVGNRRTQDSPYFLPCIRSALPNDEVYALCTS